MSNLKIFLTSNKHYIHPLNFYFILGQRKSLNVVFHHSHLSLKKLEFFFRYILNLKKNHVKINFIINKKEDIYINLLLNYLCLLNKNYSCIDILDIVYDSKILKNDNEVSIGLFLPSLLADTLIVNAQKKEYPLILVSNLDTNVSQSCFYLFISTSNINSKFFFINLLIRFLIS